MLMYSSLLKAGLSIFTSVARCPRFHKFQAMQSVRDSDSWLRHHPLRRNASSVLLPFPIYMHFPLLIPFMLISCFYYCR